MKRFVAISVMAVLFVCVVAPAARAHVLLTDQTGSKGAVLHIAPDDNPVAGQPVTLNFDTDGGFLARGAKAWLVVRSDSGQEKTIDMAVDGSLAQVDYTFPSSGVYELTFIIQADSTRSVFTESLRVAEGNTSLASDSPEFAWAKLLLIASCIGIALLAIVALNRWRAIAEQSTF